VAGGWGLPRKRGGDRRKEKLAWVGEPPAVWGIAFSPHGLKEGLTESKMRRRGVRRERNRQAMRSHPIEKRLEPSESDCRSEASARDRGEGRGAGARVDDRARGYDDARATGRHAGARKNNQNG